MEYEGEKKKECEYLMLANTHLDFFLFFFE